MKPKAVFLDMDGTILNHHNQVTERTKEIIDRVRELGVKVFIATGRSVDEIEGLVPPGFAVDGIVSSNGMAGYVGKEIVFEHSLDRKLIDIIIEKAREHKVYYELFPYGAPRVTLKQDREYVEHEIRDPQPEGVGVNEWASRKQAISGEISWVEQIEGNHFSKFYFFARTKEHIEQWKEELERLKKEIDFTMSVSSDFNAEVMVASVNKATGIKQMLDVFQISEKETLAIGDSDNDLRMLEFVEYPVAMKNAPDRVKDVANEVTEYTCDEDGVYYFLKSKYEL